MAKAKAKAAKKDKKGKPKRREKRVVPHAVAHIKATVNNTQMIAWASSGKVGFKGSRKGTPFAAQMAGRDAGILARDMGVRSLDVMVKGPGGGRESAVRALQASGLTVKSIKDVTPIPHNGCRPRKRRRV